MTICAQAGHLAIEVDPAHGARLVSFTVDALELLAADPVPGEPETFTYGCYPMVPWAGRIAGGIVEHGGAQHRLPVDGASNALHGLGLDAVWTQVDDLAFEVSLAGPWPVDGTAGLRYTLTDARLTCVLTWDGGGPGASLGFHPWFRRRLANGAEVDLEVTPVEMVERDGALPTGRFVEPTPAPWDDCFRLAGSPVLRWGDHLTLRLHSDTPWWVLFTEPEHAVCVEPQTAPPDAFSRPDWQRWLHAGSVTFMLDVERGSRS